MRFFDTPEVRKRLERIDTVAVVTEALTAHARGRVTLPQESYLPWSTHDGHSARSIAMHAWIEGGRGVGGVKIINANPANVGAGLPRASGLTILFDSETGRMTAAMPAEDVSAARTAAVSTIGVLHTRSAGACALAVVGCGPVGNWHIKTMTSTVSGFSSLVLFDRVPERAYALATRWQEKLPDWSVAVADSAREAIQRADVVVTTTTTTKPYVEPYWLRPGVTAVNVSLDDFDADVLLGCDRLFVDDWTLIAADERRLLGRLMRDGAVAAPGALPSTPTTRMIDGTIGQLITGQVTGRQQNDQVIVVNPYGLAVCDVALAMAVLSCAA